MDKEKQIEEMDDFLWRHTNMYGDDLICDVSEALVNAGYRKSSDVARKIFEEIEEMLNLQAKIVCKARADYKETVKPMLSFVAELDGRLYSLRVIEEHIAELKKKYTEEK